MVTAFGHRHVLEVKIAIVGTVLGVIVMGIGFAEWGIALVAAALVGSALSLAYTEGSYREQLRQREQDERDAQFAEQREMRRIAEMARGVLLDTVMWRDIIEWKGYWQSEGANPIAKNLPPLEWSVAAILARGRAALDPAAVDGWSAMAESLRYQASHLINLIDQEFPGPPAERRGELRTVFRAVDKAVEYAQALANPRRRAIEPRWGGTREEKERANDGLRDGADGFYAALEWLQGTIERIDDSGEVAQAIAEAAQQHRAAAGEISKAAREIRVIAASGARVLLASAAPAPEHLERSSFGSRAATLREIAAADAFAFAPGEEEVALADWIARVRRAQRAFHEAVMDRGTEMDERTHWLWTQIHNDGVLRLENAIAKLMGDVHARTGAPDSFIAAIDGNIAGSREELHASLVALVGRVDELCGLNMRSDT